MMIHRIRLFKEEHIKPHMYYLQMLHENHKNECLYILMILITILLKCSAHSL